MTVGWDVWVAPDEVSGVDGDCVDGDYVDGDTEAAAIFARMLRELDGQQFVSAVEFAAAILHLCNSTQYSIVSNGAKAPNKAGVVVNRYVCRTPGCKVSCSASYPADGGVTCVKVHNAVHTHPPGGVRRRARKSVKNFIVQSMEAPGGGHNRRVLAEKAKVGLQVYEQFSVPVNNRDITRMLNRSEKKRRASVMTAEGEGLEASIEIDGEQVPLSMDGLSPSVRAALNIIRSLLWADRNAYAKVLHDAGRVTFFFLCTGRQRALGFRFGDIRLLDAKHGTTSNQYHLAACTIINNYGNVECAGFGYLASSTNAMWELYVSHCKIVFEGVDGGTARKWLVSIVDQEPAITGAIHLVCDVPGHLVWHCFFHFMKNIEAAHRGSWDLFTPIHQAMGRLLYERHEDYTKIESDVQKLIDSIPDCQHSLKKKEQAFLDECRMTYRYLSKVPGFTNGWTSQSGVESCFAACAPSDDPYNVGYSSLLRRERVPGPRLDTYG
eukprot:GHVU01012029.1.p1 GENE.GHVU01012029.1~~GHVU01012029.1.p1  ORF type:complete len:494 (+),score=27.09 GHVU01012029.1:148-1629(+)